MSFHVSAIILKKGMKSSNSIKDIIKHWQQFLYGYFYDASEAIKAEFVIDGIFGNLTEQYTIKFQIENCLVGDGIVGPMTIAKAIEQGYGNFDDTEFDKYSLSWPKKPQSMKLLTSSEKHLIFGKIKYKRLSTGNSPESISITNGWTSKHIVSVNVPQLNGVLGAPKSCNVLIHCDVAENFQKLWTVWENEGKLKFIKSWAGMWVPRLVRGSTQTLSSHAWGTAFDINAAWNMMGRRPALMGEPGSVRELVPIAADFGFYWMGWGGNNNSGEFIDGMHFEFCNPL